MLVGIGRAMYQKTPLEAIVLSTAPKRAETAVLPRKLRQSSSSLVPKRAFKMVGESLQTFDLIATLLR